MGLDELSYIYIYKVPRFMQRAHELPLLLVGLGEVCLTETYYRLQLLLCFATESLGLESEPGVLSGSALW